MITKEKLVSSFSYLVWAVLRFLYATPLVIVASFHPFSNSFFVLVRTIDVIFFEISIDAPLLYRNSHWLSKDLFCFLCSVVLVESDWDFWLFFPHLMSVIYFAFVFFNPHRCLFLDRYKAIVISSKLYWYLITMENDWFTKTEIKDKTIPTKR